MTKSLIGDGLRHLMMNHPFEKITIKMITNEAGVIRPTFYNYFCDKYEVLEWIFSEEIVDKVIPMFDRKLFAEGIKMLFVSMKTDQQFYRKAYEVTGQNSFDSIVEKYLFDLFMLEFDQLFVSPDPSNPMMTKALVARYYTLAAANILKGWVLGEFQDHSADDMVDTFLFLLNHSLTDYVPSVKR